MHKQGWKNIEDLAEKWNFPHIVLRAMEARRELDMRCYVPHQRLMRLPLQTWLIAEQSYLQWKKQHQ